jgi:hypothetical protein
MERFVNTTHGVDDIDAYTSKFHGHPMCRETLSGLADKLSDLGTDARLLAALNGVIERAGTRVSASV